MKNSLLILLILPFTAFLINACSKDDSTVNNGNGTENINYFPDDDGRYYKYNISKSDSDGVHQGTKSVTYNGFKPGTLFHKQIDSSTTGPVTLVYESYFWKTNTGVYYFLDTAGLAGNIPPQYQQYIPFLLVDSSLTLLISPPENTWPVFKIILSLTGASIIDVKATNLGTETVNTAVVSGEALKIKYDVTIAIPSLPVQTLSAFCWFFPNVGTIKWQGSATVINALSGGGIDFGDSSTVITQDLVNYLVPMRTSKY